MTTATRRPLRGKALWQQLVREQEQWIEQCGGHLPGYIENYHGRHGRTVENAEAIYNADVAALEQYKRRLSTCR